MTTKGNIPVVVAGATGKTGSAVARAVAASPDMVLTGALARHRAGQSLGALWGDAAIDMVLTDRLPAWGIPRAVLVDFTEPDTAEERLLEAIGRGWDIVVGTTGFSAQARDNISRAVAEHGVGAVIIANFALGAWVAEQLAREASRYFKAVEVLEGHHASKRDRPSGTAQAMAAVLADSLHIAGDQVPVHSLRLPGLVAHQTVVFGAPGEVLTIQHDVHERNAYVGGVLAAIRHIHRFGGRVVSDLGEILDPPGDHPSA